VFRTVENVVCGPIGAAFEIEDLVGTKFSAACLALLVDKGDEFVHDSAPVVAHFSGENCFMGSL
jgi:hypothetical protein